MVAKLRSRRGTCDSREPWWTLPHPRLYCWHLSIHSGRERGGQGGGRRGETQAGRWSVNGMTECLTSGIPFCKGEHLGSGSKSKKTTRAFVKTQTWDSNSTFLLYCCLFNICVLKQPLMVLLSRPIQGWDSGRTAPNSSHITVKKVGKTTLEVSAGGELGGQGV